MQNVGPARQGRSVSSLSFPESSVDRLQRGKSGCEEHGADGPHNCRRKLNYVGSFHYVTGVLREIELITTF